MPALPQAHGGTRERMSTTPLSGEDIIAFSHTPWHGPWKASQQIMSLLARSNRVVYVGPQLALRDGINAIWKRPKRYRVVERVTETLSVYHGPSLWGKARGDRTGSWLFNWTTGRLRLTHIRWLARREGMHAPILWVFDPMMAGTVGTFGEKLVVYHVLDNYVEFFDPAATCLRATMAKHEAGMLAKADLVFTVSERLYQRCARTNPRTILVPNGVDYERFQAAIATDGMPGDMQRVPRPIVGHVGAVQPDMDFSLVARLAGEHPEWSLVFIGPEDLGSDRSRFEALLTRPNVYYLGSKQVQDVPLYINRCDICIMPYHVTESTADCDNIKLYEYLACGRPVVSTDVPSVRRFSPMVRIATDADEFVAQVKSSLGEDPRWAEARRREASRNSWQHRVMALSEAIVQRMGEHS
jgi:glycosyltransferase involved in cell wall biosynthesis